MTQFHDSGWWNRELKRMLEEQQPEDLHLDYKDKWSLLPRGKGGGGVNKQKRANDVSKDVSSFLNSDGGVLIYGVPEDQGSDTTGGAPVPLAESDRIGFKQGEIDKETIENLITSNIQPKPGPDLFQIIEVEHGSRIIFVIEVAVGIGDVWQAKDKRYYKRFHYKAEAMEHYEINMARDRDISPSLKLMFGLDEHWTKKKRVNNQSGECAIYVGIRNESNSIVTAALIELGVFGEDMSSPRTILGSFIHIGDRKIRFDDSQRGCADWVNWYNLPWPVDGIYRPIFRTVDHLHISNIPLKKGISTPLVLNEQRTPMRDIAGRRHIAGRLFWRIQAPNMTPKTGMVKIIIPYSQISPHSRLEISLEEKAGGFKVVGEE